MNNSVMTRPRIVVGVDGSAGSQACLSFAFKEAASRGVGLHVVHAWPFERSQGQAAVIDALSPRAEVEPQHEQLVTDAMAGWRERYPQVDVEVSVVHGRAATALLDHAEDAEMVVVGSRRRGGVAGLLLGSVTHSVLRRAECSVVVVRSRH